MIMKNLGMYGVVTLPPRVFERLNKDYFISHSGKMIVYMCANSDETRHLKLLGVKIPEDVVCDFYRIELEESCSTCKYLDEYFGDCCHPQRNADFPCIFSGVDGMGFNLWTPRKEYLE